MIEGRLSKFLLILMGTLYAFPGATMQHQAVADSLIAVYNALPVGDTSALRLLTLISNNLTDPRQKLEYSGKLMEAASKAKSLKHLHHAYLNEGQAYRLLGDFDVATYSLFKALDYAERAKFRKGVAGANTALADVYSIINDHENAVLYYNKARDLIEEDETNILAVLLLNLGDEYFQAHQYDSALVCFEQSKSIYEKSGDDPSGLAYNLGNIGLVKAELGELDAAESYVSQSVSSLNRLGDHYGIAIFLSYMADIYQKKGLLKKAKSFADSSMMISRQYGLKTEIRDISLRLADIYAMSSDYELAYKYHQEYVAIKDSISNDEMYNRIENLENAFELARKQDQVNILIAEKKSQEIKIIMAVVVALVLTILALVIYRYYRAKAKINKILEEQKASLESLNATKDKFFSIISHDLRGPISSFHGVSNMIKFYIGRNEADKLLEVADDIDRSVEGLSELLDNLLKWAMQQQGAIINQPEKLDVCEVLIDLQATYSHMAENKGIQLQVLCPENLSIWADKNVVTTIVRNLVNNALKFTATGGNVAVTAYDKDHRVIIEIKDSGIGMSAEKLNELFKLQYRKSNYGTAGEKGLGLGLQLVHEFIEMSQGKLEVESKEGEGSIFRVIFPLQKISN